MRRRVTSKRAIAAATAVAVAALLLVPRQAEAGALFVLALLGPRRARLRPRTNQGPDRAQVQEGSCR